jgi:uncharacterized protein (UPF0332 family)
MEPSVREMILGQTTKAEEKLRAAQVLMKGGFLDDAISRAYYAIFHAAGAVLLSEGISVESHSALKDMFGLHFVKTGKIDRKYGRILSKLKDERETGDYDIYTSFEQDDAGNAVKEAGEFLAAMKSYLAVVHHLEF